MSNKENTMEEVIEEVIVEEVIEKPYTLRKLKDKDLFPVLGIITKVLPGELAQIFVDITTGNKNAKEIGAFAGYNLVVAVLKNISTVHDEVYTLLEDVSGIPAAEIQEMEFGTTPMMLWDIVNDVKNASFFKVLSKLL